MPENQPGERLIWSRWDRWLASWRYAAIQKHLLHPAVFCDIGCGMSGEFLRSISARIEQGYGFDRQVQAKTVGNIRLQPIADLNAGIPLLDESVDHVSMIAFFEHLANPQLVLAEVRRILKTGGRLLISTPSSKAKPLLGFLAFRLKIIAAYEIAEHKRYYQAASLRHCLEEAGFTVIFYKTFQFGLNQIVVAQKNQLPML
jgi:ubiquinone/menaquinone biosynthesis C-methylase UbiE